MKEAQIKIDYKLTPFLMSILSEAKNELTIQELSSLGLVS
jgi:hypothetical protein